MDNSTKRIEITEKTNIEDNMPDIKIRDEKRGQRTISYFSMFSGIGGFEYGIERVFAKNSNLCESTTTIGNKARQQQQFDNRSAEGLSCIGYSEIDKYADSIYQHNFKGHKNYGDATRIDADALPDFDLLVGGFPCQAFSIAGKRLGFDDTRGTLFFEIARILKVKRPKHFILENVKGLLSHDNGRTFKTIISTLIELGYGVEWQVLNSKNHGVPQNRERVFIVGYLGGEGCGKVFPVGENARLDNKTRYSEKQKVYRCLEATEYKGISSERFNGVAEGTKIRRLTPIECERLQSFPDNWTKYGVMNGKVVEISDSQRYKCLGNAVTTSVVAEVIRKMFNQ